MLVQLVMFLRNKFFSILQVLGNLLRDFLGRVYFSIPILHTSLSYLCEPDQPIISLVVAVVAGIPTPANLMKS